MHVLGHLNVFDPKVDEISTYLKQVQVYFEANVEDDSMFSVLLTLTSREAYETLRSLLTPNFPQD